MKRLFLGILCSLVLLTGMTSCTDSPPPQWAVDQVNANIAEMQVHKLHAQAIREHNLKKQ